MTYSQKAEELKVATTPGFDPANPHIWTSTGKKFYFLQPHEDMIDIEDIGQALSKICRYTGHTKEHYSVAQHSVIVAKYLQDHNHSIDTVLWGLLHDATEAYIGDLSGPVKSLLPRFKDIEDDLMECIARKFRLSWPMPEAVKHIDKELLVPEMASQFPPFKYEKGQRIEGLRHGLAYHRFMSEFYRLRRNAFARLLKIRSSELEDKVDAQLSTGQPS